MIQNARIAFLLAVVASLRFAVSTVATADPAVARVWVQHNSGPVSAELSQSGRFFYVFPVSGGQAVIYDSATRKKVGAVSCGVGAVCRFAPDSTALIVCDQSNRKILVAAVDGSTVKTLRMPDSIMGRRGAKQALYRSLCVSNDGGNLYVVLRGGEVVEVDLSSGEDKVLANWQSDLRGFGFSRDEAFDAIVCIDCVSDGVICGRIDGMCFVMRTRGASPTLKVMESAVGIFFVQQDSLKRRQFVVVRDGEYLCRIGEFDIESEELTVTPKLRERNLSQHLVVNRKRNRFVELMMRGDRMPTKMSVCDLKTGKVIEVSVCSQFQVTQVSSDRSGEKWLIKDDGQNVALWQWGDD